MIRKATRRASAIAILMTLAMTLSAAPAFARGPGGGSGGGGGGGGGETTVANNLSVPAVFIGSAGFGLTNPDLQMPTGDPSTGWAVDPTGYYYVQGTNKWQAQYTVMNSDTATAKWGDNLLGGSASLKAGHPIRVEMGLTSDDVTTMTGFTVIKLQPSLADRLSKYGTKATADPTSSTGWAGTPVANMSARVWVDGATLTISGPSGTTTVAMPGEINATGAVVFGYNWRPSEPGVYTLTFKVPAGTVTFSNPAGAVIEATVVAGGSGGGGHRG